MRSNYFAIFVILILALSSFTIAQTDDLATTEPVVDTTEHISYDVFYKNPTYDNWNQLSYEDQVSFYSDFSNVGVNPKIDADYFSNPANIGQNPQADNRFFTGAYSDNPKTAGIENFQTYSKSASAYIQKTFDFGFKVTFPDGKEEELAQDFVFNKDDGTLTNNGKTITLLQFQSDEDVKSIQTTEDGFVMCSFKLL